MAKIENKNIDFSFLVQEENGQELIKVFWTLIDDVDSEKRGTSVAELDEDLEGKKYCFLVNDNLIHFTDEENLEVETKKVCNKYHIEDENDIASVKEILALGNDYRAIEGRLVKQAFEEDYNQNLRDFMFDKTKELREFSEQGDTVLNFINNIIEKSDFKATLEEAILDKNLNPESSVYASINTDLTSSIDDGTHNYNCFYSIFIDVDDNVEELLINSTMNIKFEWDENEFKDDICKNYNILLSQDNGLKI
jgi:hypothetical protein